MNVLKSPGDGDVPGLVNFVIGGTQKGGTTALDNYLRGHPAILMARRKEVHFFDQDHLFRSDAVDCAAYHAHFAPGASSMLRGEATPIYMYWEASPRRVHAYNPGMKWVLLLRNPLERAWSHWNMERARHREPLAFLDALQQEQRQLLQEPAAQHRVRSYLGRGMYALQIRRIRQLFPAAQTFVARSEALRSEPAAVLDAVCDFLQVDRLPAKDYPPLHVGSYERGMSSAERDFLRERLAPDIRALEALLSWDCSDWLA